MTGGRPHLATSDQAIPPGEERPAIRRHWQLAVIVGVFVCLAAIFSALLPLGEAADETDHFALVRFIAERGRPPLTIDERNAIGPKGDASPVYHGLVALLTQYADISALPTLPETQARPERLISTDGFTANRVFHTEDERWPWRGVVLAWHLARLVSVPLGAVTIVAAYVTALSILPHRPSVAVAAAAVVAFLPRFVINSAVVNDDALVVPLVALAVYGMVRIAQGDQGRRTCLLVGLAMGLAAITKYHSLVLVPEATLLFIVLAWRSAVRSAIPRPIWLAWLRRWGWMMAAFILTAGWWFAFLIARFNQVAELGWVRGLAVPLGDPVLTTGLSQLIETPAGAISGYAFGWDDWASLLFRSFWITYGWLHVFAPTWVYSALGVILALSAAGLGGQILKTLANRARWLSPLTWRWDIAWLALHLLVYCGIIVLRQASRPARETAQGRHLYPALTALAFFVAYGLNRLPDGMRSLMNAVRRRPAGANSVHAEASLRPWRALGTAVLPGTLLALSLAALPGIILPTYQPYLPIRSLTPKEATIGQRLKVSFAPGLTLVGYDPPPLPGGGMSTFAVGTGIPITLYWHADASPTTRDYLTRLCLQDVEGRAVLCIHSHPVDGRYPTRAWEAGYLIRDELLLPTPACLSGGDYEISLEMLPLRADTLSTTVDTAIARRPPISLGRVSLAPTTGASVASSRVSVWTGRGQMQEHTWEVRQLRQVFTVLVENAPGAAAWLTSRREPYLRWRPAVSSEAYRCPTGVEVTAHSFVADAAVRLGEYLLQADGADEPGAVVQVSTRWRDFDPPTTPAKSLEAVFAGCAEDTSAPCIDLIGYTLDDSPRWAGESISLTALWQARRTMGRNYVVALYLLDNLMNVGGHLDWSLGGHYPNVLWAPGEYVPETYHLPVFPNTPPGLYTIQLSLYDYRLSSSAAGPFTWLSVVVPPLDAPSDRIHLGKVRVRDADEGRPPGHQRHVDLDGQIRLIGYDLVLPAGASLVPGRTLPLVLYWQAIRRAAQDYTVFTQMVGPDGRVYGQQDNQPQGGRYPTTAWETGQVVIDRYDLTLGEGAPRGQYRLLVGMYDLATGVRLTAMDEDGRRLPDDAVELTTLAVE
jgi:4-amino-4-deoxy-L-arabinose transferase-like glycosyltransferase